MKKNIMLVLLGMFIMTVISAGVYAINASEINYKDTTVDSALDDLYDFVEEYKTVEDVLWTNSSPSATFAAQVVTLSSPITEYDYIKIIYNTNPTTAQNHEFMAIFPISNLSAYTSQIVSLGGRPTDAASGGYVRSLGLGDTASKIQFGASVPGNSTGANNNLIIPKQIIGIK